MSKSAAVAREEHTEWNVLEPGQAPTSAWWVSAATSRPPFPLGICDVTTSPLCDLRPRLPSVYLCSQATRSVIPRPPQVASGEKVVSVHKQRRGQEQLQPQRSAEQSNVL